MPAHLLIAVQRIPQPLERAWDFFCDPVNLAVITPPSMRFQISPSHNGRKMYPGQLIEYTVRPLLGIPLYWMTEITHVMPNEYFIDEQRFGPYRFWQHQHFFKEIDGGVEMTDQVTYRIPFGAIGKSANGLLVKSKLREIFTFRYKKVEELMGKWPGSSAMQITMR